jgi:hypothetical protein
MSATQEPTAQDALRALADAVRSSFDCRQQTEVIEALAEADYVLMRDFAPQNPLAERALAEITKAVPPIETALEPALAGSETARCAALAQEVVLECAGKWTFSSLERTPAQWHDYIRACLRDAARAAYARIAYSYQSRAM